MIAITFSNAVDITPDLGKLILVKKKLNNNKDKTTEPVYMQGPNPTVIHPVKEKGLDTIGPG